MFHSGKRKKNPETDIQGTIKEYLQWRGFFVYRNQQNIGSLRGIADLTALKDGMPALYVEVKSVRGVLSDDQRQFGDMVVNHGHCYIVARSLEDLLRQVPGL